MPILAAHLHKYAMHDLFFFQVTTYNVCTVPEQNSALDDINSNARRVQWWILVIS